MKNNTQTDFLQELGEYSNPDLVKMDQNKLVKISDWSIRITYPHIF